MTDKCREELKKYLANFHPSDKPPTRQEIFESAWNASHDRCAEICDYLENRIGQDDVGFDDVVKAACKHIKEMIQADKVKL
jgi:hypothetical protein